MMGPLSVAQYLEQGKLTFDLIVMDEASQLRPEDALGAIARGRQLVVVGDPKQLPPTNFFDRLMEDDEDDADETSSVVEGVESILGICEHLYRPVRTLRWHYRSKHESLIAFSNSQFYDHRLVVFPSPYRRNRRLGVNYRYVKEGLYKDRRNVPEAQRVVDAVLAHITSSPEESLGVVTLNQTQRQLIEDILDVQVRGNKAVSDYFEMHEKAGWPFFVKNLENVQGDERDVIFVSTTFGRPGPGEAIRQNFGPINRSDGWRRLNVLFTRARRRIDLFTSLQPNDIRLDEKASLGKKALQDYLTFASTGRLPGAPGTSSEREADSEFEIAVADALRQRGYETEPQVGVAGYFLDLGVRHPERRSEYLAGIECDGVTYHSSLSARDRDRIRQEVLESLGWHGRIIRVWSTDWFSDPEAQTDRLVAFLERRRRQDESSPRPYSDDDLELAEAYIANEEASDELEESVPDTPAAIGAPDLAIELSLFVEVGDRVTYETLQPAERHTVTIVDSPSNPKLGLLNDQTPVAQALLGLCAGDKAELRVQGHPLRDLRVRRVERPVDDGWVSEDAPE
jgi:transcription elongation GreA/GreB family factor